MVFRLLIVLFVAAAVAGCASRSSKPAPAASKPSGYMEAGDTYSARNAPPMEEKRPVNVQDCTKEINLQAGNLMCQ